MFLPEVPFETVESNPRENLQKLKNGLADFEKMGFAASLNEDPGLYAKRQLALLQDLLNDQELAATYENEIIGLFLKEYYLRSLLMASDLYMKEALDIGAFFTEFKNMQQVIRDVFPFWIENDYLYGLGKNRLNIFKSVNIDLPGEKELDTLLKDVAILGMPPAVSIVMPTYNRGEKLLNVLPTILNQTYKNFELIIVDDGSDDNTKEIVEMFGNPKIKYIKLNQNSGQSKARNIGIKEASYNYIAFADSDDFWNEKKLEEQMDLLLHTPNAGFCHCACTYYDENEKKYVLPSRNISKVRKTGYIYPELLHKNMIVTAALVVKKECIEAVGGFNEEINCLEDWEFILRLSKQYEAAFCVKELFEIYEAEDKVSNQLAEEGPKAIESFYSDFQRDRMLFGIE
ncbi:MAG: glycosyltransferase [Lachnospiraceae bacterium]|nr:glycosyltransferase [Lachnospiraceae bacterium]